jgi:hypothetical protein
MLTPITQNRHQRTNVRNTNRYINKGNYSAPLEPISHNPAQCIPHPVSAG